MAQKGILIWIFALVAGLASATVDTAAMIPITFDTPSEKRQAMTAAFVDRFFLGFMTGPVAAGLNANGLLIGALLGIGTSIGTAIITKTWAPVIIMGLLTGLGVGFAYQLLY